MGAWLDYRDRCEICGRFVRQCAPGVSWRQEWSYDMGGTTAKGAIIRNGEPERKYEMEVARIHEFRAGSGLPVRVPVVDMIEIGAGGGSIAEIDERGLIRVGPRSAGASPGPAC